MTRSREDFHLQVDAHAGRTIGIGGSLAARSVSKPETRRRSPEGRSTAFPASPPDLPPRPLMAMDFAILCSLVRPGRPRYPVLVHRAAALLHASFNPRHHARQWRAHS